MAGWSKRVVDGSSLKRFRKPKIVSKPEPSPNNYFVNYYGDAKLLFIEILTVFYKEVTGPLCYRPLPPMLGDGKSVDLFKLYLVVRRKGGISANGGSWGLVAEDCGFDSSYGLALKLVYVKYLDALERWMFRLKETSVKNEVSTCNLGSGWAGLPTDVELDLKEILAKIEDEKRNLSVKDVKKTRNADFDEKLVNFVNGKGSVVDGANELIMKSSLVKEDCDSRKRKRECYLDMVKWVKQVAKNPCDLAIGAFPERSKRNDYGNEVVWKQVLLLRDEMLVKRNVDTRAQCSVWQIKQKMHPSMYDDSAGPERVRCSPRVLFAKDHLKKKHPLHFSVSSLSNSRRDEDQGDRPTDSSAESAVRFWWKQQRKRIPAVGPQFQADIPEWIGEIYKSDSKWLGTRIWPLDEPRKSRMLIERDIGKGRQDICGCKSPGSYGCIKFHLLEKRKKVRVDLGSAYYQWKFDSMGEEVALSWSIEEELKFQDIVKSNPLSEDKSFWNDIFKFFPNKSRESLVSYYFNVFLLRRRGDQNRTNASNVGSDDDESEYGPRFDCFGRDAKFSIFPTPRKSTTGAEVAHES